MKRISLVLLALLAIVIGLYPIAYFIFDMKMGLLGTKPPALLTDTIWLGMFYVHISLGGLALSIGWIQFWRNFRNRNLRTHRLLGKVYILSIILSGTAALYLAGYATGGLIAKLGFAALAVGWLFTTGTAYRAIRKKKITSHEHWMVRSYAFCFAAVTLRIWLPALDQGVGLGFITSYQIVAWLCWVPNVIVGEFIIRRMTQKQNLVVSA